VFGGSIEPANVAGDKSSDVAGVAGAPMKQSEAKRTWAAFLFWGIDRRLFSCFEAVDTRSGTI
jgi:hypothetical protein